MTHIQRVAGAGVVGVETGIVGGQTVVRGIINSAERQSGAQMIAFCSVVINDVQDHLDAGRVQSLHHGLEFVDAVGSAVARLRSEETDGVVAPIIAQTALH